MLTISHKSHDDSKLAIVERAHHAHVDCDAEIFGLFRDLVPAAALQPGGELENARARSGKVPDLAYRLPTPPGPNDRIGRQPRLLAELKVINAGPTKYLLVNKAKAVDRRDLPGEYHLDLGRLDRQFHGTVAGQIGPLVRR